MSEVARKRRTMVYSVGLRSVVAGVGGSSSRRSAVRIAAEYAVRHRLPLQLVCGFPSASYGWPALGMAGYAAVVSQRARRDADAVLAEAADELRSAYLGVEAPLSSSLESGVACR
jgi:hypothetical protein